MSERLAAAKPVVWRGAGELLQVPWQAPGAIGTWLVVDLWSGCGGLLYALLSLGVRCIALAVEHEPNAVACCKAAFPNVVHCSDVAQVKQHMFRGVIERRNIAGIIVGGGSPCQGNTILNAQRRGLHDPRSHGPTHLARIRSDLQEFGIPVLSFLENVASMDDQVRLAYSKCMGGLPLEVEAADFGWV